MSLRNRLITGIAIVLVLASLITAALGGVGMRREVNQLLDQQLAQIARLSAQVVDLPIHPITIPRREWRREDKDNIVIVQRWYGERMVPLVPTTLRLPQPSK